MELWKYRKIQYVKCPELIGQKHRQHTQYANFVNELPFVRFPVDIGTALEFASDLFNILMINYN